MNSCDCEFFEKKRASWVEMVPIPLDYFFLVGPKEIGSEMR